MATIDLRKMQATADEKGNVYYTLTATVGSPISINSLIGKQISLHFTGNIICCSCGKPTKKSFSQGYCYKCFISSPETEECLLKPHLCQAHLGIARDMNYAKEHCLIDHYVYLANSGGLKVGVTRHTQIPTRWIDQGASEGLIVAKTPNRYLAGAIEVDLMRYFSDKTNWRSMLTNKEVAINLYEQKEKLKNLIDSSLSSYIEADTSSKKLIYPVKEYPSKVTSLSFDKQANIEARLAGIRGQYLIFEGGEVLNMRTFTGYQIELSY